MTDTSHPIDLEEAQAHAADISARILAGATDVTAADLVAAEAKVDEARAVAERQRQLDREAARIAAEQAAHAQAAELREQLAALVTDTAMVDLDEAHGEAAAAVAKLAAAVAAHNARIDSALAEVAALPRRGNVAEVHGLREVASPLGGSKVVEVSGAGHLGAVKLDEVVAAAVADVFDSNDHSEVAATVARAAKAAQQRRGWLQAPTAARQTAEERHAAAEARREARHAKHRQVQLARELAEIRAGRLVYLAATPHAAEHLGRPQTDASAATRAATEARFLADHPELDR